MNLTTFSLSICGAFLIASLSTNYILYNKLDQAKVKLTLSEVSNKNLTKSLEIQNKGLSTSEAVCKVNLDLIEGAVNEFFEK